MGNENPSRLPEVVPLAALAGAFPAPQVPSADSHGREYRHLTSEEIDALVRQGNAADDWSNLRVVDPFYPACVRNCCFHGQVHIGRLTPAAMLRHNDLFVPVGLYDSRIAACRLGDDVAVHRVGLLGGYELGDRAAILDVGEMFATPGAAFGQALGRTEAQDNPRGWMALVNETGARAVPPVDGLTAGDAWLWAGAPEDAQLRARLVAMSRRAAPAGCGTVGEGAVVAGCRSLRNVRLGQAARVERANRLHELTIHSSPDEPTVIADGVQLAHGIVGTGCQVRNAVTAERFVLRPHSRLLNGARLFDTLLGENSTIACCEVLCSLIFPAHEQHHNNSFLIAALVQGQSNIAAGATIGSNHNSRSADGELIAGRGFWPGLCVSLKHNCRFAAFTLLAKGDYPAELDVPLPMSLLSNDAAQDRLLILPAFWWMHNMYALVRNAWKFHQRDRRLDRRPRIEFDYLAPDSAEQMLTALSLLEEWTARACLRQQGPPPGDAEPDPAEPGRRALREQPAGVDKLEVLAEGVENSRRKVIVLKAGSAWQAYRQMLSCYAVRALLDWLDERPASSLSAMHAALQGPRQKRWVNLGGQLVPGDKLDALRDDIRAGRLEDWPAVHAACDRLADEYILDRRRHAYAVLLGLHQAAELTPELWRTSLAQARHAQHLIVDRAFAGRRKDYDGHFRQITFQSPAQQQAVLGELADDPFLRQLRQQAADFDALAARHESLA